MIYSPPSEICVSIRRILMCDEPRALSVERFIETCGYSRQEMTENEFRQLVYRVDKLLQTRGPGASW